MKLLVIGDLHGRKPVISEKEFDAIILVGDVCDDRKIAPVYKEFFRKLKNSDSSLNFDEFAVQKLGSKKKLEKYEKDSLMVGRKILKYLNSFGKPVFMVAGNWDDSYGKTKIKNPDKNDYTYLKYFYDKWLGDRINPELTKGLINIKNCMFHNNEFKGINFIGYGLSSAPEDIGLRTRKRKKKLKKNLALTKLQIKILIKSYKQIVDKLYLAYSKRKNKSLPAIFITHNIPYRTKLDIVTDRKSYAYKKHLGSTVAREFCLKFQPVICVGGHIHDHRGKDKIRKTLIINPGYGKKAQILIDFDEEKRRIKKIKFIK